MASKSKKQKAFLVDLSELTVKGRSIDHSVKSGKFTHGGNKYLVTKPEELAANFSGGELMTIYENVTGIEAPSSWSKAGKAKTAEKVFKAMTEAKLTFTELGSRSDGSNPSVSSRFKELISAGGDKLKTLETIKGEFPDRDIPDSYFNWYKRKVEKESK